MKKRRLNRRGYFFLIDSILAMSVLAIGGFLVFSLYAQTPSKSEPTIISEDVMDFFANTRIKNVDNTYAGLGGTLWNQGKITNAENTLLQQVGVFYANNDIATARTFIEELTKNTLPTQYAFEFWVDSRLIYPDTEQSQLKNAAKVLIPSKKMVYGILDQQTGEIFGPYTAEVLVWQ